MSTAEPAGCKFVWPQIDEAHARLHELEKQDRRHWISACAIMLVLAVALCAVSLPGVRVAQLSSRAPSFVAFALLLLVVLFALRALQLQRSVARMRRELASELAIIAASETLKIAAGKANETEEDRRKAPRVACDQRLSVSANYPNGIQELYGRIIDVCEHGMGAIVPGALTPGQEVVLQFSLNGEGGAKAIKVAAIVRQRSGFRYGFNFVGLNDSDREQIEDLRLDSQTVINSVKSATASSTN